MPAIFLQMSDVVSRVLLDANIGTSILQPSLDKVKVYNVVGYTRTLLGCVSISNQGSIHSSPNFHPH